MSNLAPPSSRGGLRGGGPEARIDLSALANNARAILQKTKPRGLLAVIKWNAYGHGLIQCAKTLCAISEGDNPHSPFPPYDRGNRKGGCGSVAAFGVSSPQEGIALRQAGITTRILVMTDWVGKPPRHFLDWNLEIAATSWFKVELIEAMSRRLGRNIPAHIKFDTGLGRVGIHHSQAREALTRIAKMPHLKVAAIYSHLGYSGPQDHERGARQIEIFENIVKLAGELGIDPEWIHLANSAAAIGIPNVPGNLVRTGIALYGQPPSKQILDLTFPPYDGGNTKGVWEPVMTLVGHVTTVRRLRRGHGFPSAHFWTAPMDGWGAEVNLGYSVSYPRSLAGKAHVLLNGKRCPLVGVMTRDTSHVFTREKPEVGDEVVFWGRQGDETLYLYEIASHIDALPYELPTWLSAKLPRVFRNAANAVTRAA